MLIKYSDNGIAGSSYRGPGVPEWLPGEVRDVDEGLGGYLLGNFPGIFFPVASAEQPTPAALDRKMRTTVKRGNMTK